MKLNFIFLLFLILVLQGCNYTKFDEIHLNINKDKEVYINEEFQSFLTQTEKWRLKSLVQKSLINDKKSFTELIEFNCGGGAYCYDLGGVIAQIIYRVGEENTVELVKDLTPKQAGRLHFLIKAGLEYGTKNHEIEIVGQLIEDEFPVLDKTLQRLSKCEECL